MTAPTRRPRRPGGRESPTLARLTAAREQLDAEIVERRGREDALLTEYAAATDAVTAAEARRDAALAELERQAAQLREAAGQELATLEARQGAVLVALHGDRTTEELAQLETANMGMPIGSSRWCATAADTAAAAAPPLDRPAAASTPPAAAAPTAGAGPRPVGAGSASDQAAEPAPTRPLDGEHPAGETAARAMYWSISKFWRRWSAVRFLARMVGNSGRSSQKG